MHKSMLLHSIIIQYNGPGPLSALSDSPTDHRLTMLHAANRNETASAIMPCQQLGVSLTFYYLSHFISGFIAR